MRHFLIFLLLCSGSSLHAQLYEDFSDGNYTTNPVWTGSNNGADFVINDNKLRSNSNVANAGFFLSTENSLAINAQWELWMNLQFSTSGSNYVDIYVISDKADLKNTLINGFFIRIGNTDDEISLYKRSGTTGSSVKIIDGVNGSIGSTNNTVRIRLKRDNIGNFTLEREIVASSSSFFTEGTASDPAHITSTHFGVLVQQSTASFFQKHFFDNIKIAALASDTIPPMVSAVSAIDSNTISITFNEEMDSLSTKIASNYAISNNGGPVLKVFTTNDPAKFHLKLTQSLKNGSFTVSASNVNDKNGNVIINNNTGTFSFTKPYLAKFGDIAINEIFPDPSPQIDLPSVEFAELRNNTDQTLSLKNWKFSDSGNSATFGEITIDPYSLLIICAKADTAEFKSYGQVLGISPWPSLNNSGELIKLLSPESTLIDSIRYSDAWYRSPIKKQGGWTLERKHPQPNCHGFLNWFASTDATGGTPGKENSIYVPDYHILPLRADSIKQLTDTTLKIHFNKPVNVSTIIAQNFVLNPSASPVKKIISDYDFRELVLTYDQKLLSDTEYFLAIANIRDCYGVLLTNWHGNLSFKTNKPPSVIHQVDTSKIIITEIFADPSPEVGLPLAEYVEIFNPSKDTVDLDRWTINDPTTKGTIRGRKILPGEYMILCPAADTVHYNSYGRTIGLNPWPSLNNNSDQIVLKSFNNRVVDSVAYSDTWYRSSLKKAGGWSIEKIDLSSVCGGIFNWTASVDTIGGTPGKINSVNISGYDRLELKADSLKLVSDTTIKLYFNKHLNAASLIAENFSLTPTNSVKKITSDAEIKVLTLSYDKIFLKGTEYQLSISNLSDCSGQNLSGPRSLFFKTSQPLPPIPDPIDTATIVISEIFADPSPEIGLPLAEFIELYNPGKDAVNLNKWILSDSGTKAAISNVIISAGEYLILCPVADTVLFRQFGKTKGISPWPSLGNAGDQITLKSFKQRLVDSVAFSDKWYKSRVKKNGGWSLEKTDLLNRGCNGFYNWASSVDPIGGTPGRVNSVNNQWFDHQIRIDSVRYTSDSTIILFLNSIADTMYLKPSVFTIDNGIGKAIAITIDESYKEIRLRFASKFHEGIQYILTADPLLNCLGKSTHPPNNQASFTIPTIPELDYPVLINEIMADPSPKLGLPEVEFVELYNPTEQPVSLKGMSYGDEGLQYEFSSGEIAAKSYLILCPAKETESFSAFGKVLGLPVWPSLSNEKDVLILKNNKGRQLQKVAYNSGWYRETEKKAGGYSLELINSSSICPGSQNWGASIDPAGGTPGRQNSIFSISPGDALRLEAVVMKDSITLLLTFNKSVDSLSASPSDNYLVNNGVGAPETALPVSPNFREVVLKLKQPPSRGHTYKIELKNIQDCSGSSISTGFNHGEFILPEKITKNAILLSEVLFNPRPGGVDFVEVYNNSKHTLDLQEISIATIVNDTIGNPKRISLKQLLLHPGHYLSITSDPEIIKKEYRTENVDGIFKASLPSFNDDKGTVVLLSNGIKIDQLNYTEKMHFQLLKSFEGISLERSSFNRNSNEHGNFRSATAESGFATPGYKNSQHADDLLSSDEFALISKTFSPDNDGFEDLLQVSYRMPAPGMVANVKIFNDKGLLIKHLLRNSTLNAEGLFVWDGLNEFGVAAGSGIYFISAEIFDTNGHLKRFRKSFALAVKL